MKCLGINAICAVAVLILVPRSALGSFQGNRTATAESNSSSDIEEAPVPKNASSPGRAVVHAVPKDPPTWLHLTGDTCPDGGNGANLLGYYHFEGMGTDLKPIYQHMTTAKQIFIYDDPDCDGSDDHFEGGWRWIIDQNWTRTHRIRADREDDLDGDRACQYMARTSSSGDDTMPPSGTWHVNCGRRRSWKFLQMNVAIAKPSKPLKWLFVEVELCADGTENNVLPGFWQLKGTTSRKAPYYQSWSHSYAYLYLEPSCYAYTHPISNTWQWVFDNQEPSTWAKWDLARDGRQCTNYARIESADTSKPPSGKWSVFCRGHGRERLQVNISVLAEGPAEHTEQQLDIGMLMSAPTNMTCQQRRMRGSVHIDAIRSLILSGLGALKHKLFWMIFPLALVCVFIPWCCKGTKERQGQDAADKAIDRCGQIGGGFLCCLLSPIIMSLFLMPVAAVCAKLHFLNMDHDIIYCMPLPASEKQVAFNLWVLPFYALLILKDLKPALMGKAWTNPREPAAGPPNNLGPIELLSAEKQLSTIAVHFLKEVVDVYTDVSVLISTWRWLTISTLLSLLWACTMGASVFWVARLNGARSDDDYAAVLKGQLLSENLPQAILTPLFSYFAEDVSQYVVYSFLMAILTACTTMQTLRARNREALVSYELAVSP